MIEVTFQNNKNTIQIKFHDIQHKLQPALELNISKAMYFR